MISYIFSGKFAVLPSHGLSGDKLVPAGDPGGVRAVHSGTGVMPVVLGQVSRLGNSELGFYFQVFQVLSLLLSLYIKLKVEGGAGVHALWGVGGPPRLSPCL